MPQPILLIAPQNDVHALTIQTILEKEFSREAFIWDTSRLSRDEFISFYPSQNEKSFRVELENCAVSGEDIASIWWRRPNGYTKNVKETPGKISTFKKNEYAALFYGALASLGVPIINDPFIETIANRKPYQLYIARICGLRVPETIISNKPAAIQEFWWQNNRNCIYKTLTPMEGQLLETRRLAEEDLASLDKVRHAPVIVQEVIPGLDIRVNVIGEDVFFASVQTNMHESELDWRIDPTIKWEKHDADKKLIQKLLLFVKKLGLWYGSVDMRLTPEGEYVFLEINPSGQFLFIEIDTGLPLCNSFCELLVNPAKSGGRS